MSFHREMGGEIHAQNEERSTKKWTKARGKFRKRKLLFPCHESRRIESFATQFAGGTLRRAPDKARRRGQCLDDLPRLTVQVIC